jgi:hypothetical protein
MPKEPDQIPRHESVEHEHPTDVGMMEDDARHVPGTGVLGDETLVREVPGGLQLPTPAASSHGTATRSTSAAESERAGETA